MALAGEIQIGLVEYLVAGQTGPECWQSQPPPGQGLTFLPEELLHK
eukprot:gene9214-9381_t